MELTVGRNHVEESSVVKSEQNCRMDERNETMRGKKTTTTTWERLGHAMRFTRNGWFTVRWPLASHR